MKALLQSLLVDIAFPGVGQRSLRVLRFAQFRSETVHSMALSKRVIFSVGVGVVVYKRLTRKCL